MILVLVSGTFEMFDTPHKGDTFGQQFDMPDDLARLAVLSGAQLVPKEAFDSCGFNEKEIADYPNARLQAYATDAFKAKLAKAREAASAYRLQLATPAPTKQPNKPTEVKA